MFWLHRTEEQNSSSLQITITVCANCTSYETQKHVTNVENISDCEFGERAFKFSGAETFDHILAHQCIMFRIFI